MTLEKFISKTITSIKECSPLTHEIEFDLYVMPVWYGNQKEWKIIVIGTAEEHATHIKFRIDV